MLSRIAESLFWIGRYIERASDQARVLEVHLDVGSDPISPGSAQFGTELCRAMGVPPENCDNFDDVWGALGVDPSSPIAIVSTFNNCRDSARRCREILSTSSWEAINRSWLAMTSSSLTRLRPAEACRRVRDYCAMIVGTLDDTMTRDQAWHFLIAGRHIERVDMTSRVLYATIVAPERPAPRHMLLQACGAQQAFVMTGGRDHSLASAVDFLLRDRLFPRSVVHSLTTAQEALAALDPGVLRTGFEDDAQRLLGGAAASVEYEIGTSMMDDLAGRTAHLQDICSRATSALTSRYFEGALLPEWHER